MTVPPLKKRSVFDVNTQCSYYIKHISQIQEIKSIIVFHADTPTHVSGTVPAAYSQTDVILLHAIAEANHTLLLRMVISFW